MMPGMPYDNRTVPVPPDARLVVFSDGVFEIDVAVTGKMWPFEDFLAYLGGLMGREGMIETQLAHSRSLSGSDTLADDFSMIEAWFPAAEPDAKRKKKPPADRGA
jgi:sigma-B regulation protein RsbU (phosphoserine phosphatase)